MNNRDAYIEDIIRMEKARDKTNSVYLKRDYTKAIKRKKQELAFYDRKRTETYIRGC